MNTPSAYIYFEKFIPSSSWFSRNRKCILAYVAVGFVLSVCLALVLGLTTTGKIIILQEQFITVNLNKYEV